jgi:hypothetical protein
MKRLLISMILGLTGPASGLAQQAVPEQGAPPTNLERLGDGHWTANTAPPEDTSGFQVHTVETGDTLWAIAIAYMNDPFLWPQLWEANGHIVNPHWIYPEDLVLIRPVTNISEVVPPPPPPVPAPEPQAAPRTVQIPTLTRIDDYVFTPDQIVFNAPEAPDAAPVKPVDLYCSGFVTTQDLDTGSSILSLTPPAEGMLAAEGAYVYVSGGANAGVASGDIFTVFRPTRNVESTRDGVGTLGRHHLELGQIQAVMVQPAFSLARVVHSCAEMTVGDRVMEFDQIDFPDLPAGRPFSPFMPPSGGTAGAVAMTLDILLTAPTPALGGVSIIAGYRGGIREYGPVPGVNGGIAAAGRIVYLDLGQSDGVQTGDIFIVYRPIVMDGNPGPLKLSREARDLLGGERYAIGEVVVVKVGERAATALVTFSSDGISPGDLVEVR